MNTNKTIMIQGTTSDAGKSTLVAALCRIYARKNINVAPFKPQNMALNAAVTPCGGEIGRAQAVQAQAARQALKTDFNPVLLKPQSDTFAQVIINGKALPAMDAKSYHSYKKVAAQAVFAAHHRLVSDYERVVVEGAGSPAEINLREGDIANMGFAEEADCPVIIIADIDKGGVFAHLVGTLALLSPSEQNRVVGFVINRFRGDISLLQSGLDWLEEYTQKPVLGVLPYLHGLTIASEDAVVTQQEKENVTIKVVVPITPLMSNHNDFDALRTHPSINIEFVKASVIHETRLPSCDLILLAGSKNVADDLAFIRAQGWDKDIEKHLRYGGKIFGICGGYQMLGKAINDPNRVESKHLSYLGLGYLDMETTFANEKALVNKQGSLTIGNTNASVSGYEIHHGVAHYQQQSPLIKFDDGSICGDMDASGQVAGCYLHGIFDQEQAIQVIVNWCGFDIEQHVDLHVQQEQAIDKLADVCQQYLDLEKIETLIQQWERSNDD